MQNLQPFFDSSLPYLRHPEVQEWGKALSAEREKEKATREARSEST